MATQAHKDLVEAHTPNLDKDEAAYEEWASFFAVTQNADHLCESNSALDGLRSLVRYCTYLKRLNAYLLQRHAPIWHLNSFIVGVFVGMSILTAIYLLSAH